jgi:hypothetical protein
MEVEAMEDSMRWGFSYTDVLPSISDARVWAHGQCLGVVRQVEVEPEPGELAYPPSMTCVIGVEAQPSLRREMMPQAISTTRRDSGESSTTDHDDSTSMYTLAWVGAWRWLSVLGNKERY